MKHVNIMPALIVVVLNAVILAGCAGEKSSPPPPPGAVAVRIIQASAANIVQSSARQEGEVLVVAGKVARQWIGNRGVVKGHVDIDVLDASGKTLRSLTTRCSPPVIPNLSNVQSSFMARIPLLAPDGGVVKVRFHAGPDANREIL